MFDTLENEMQCKNIMQTLKVSWLRRMNFIIGHAYPKHIFVVNEEAQKLHQIQALHSCDTFAVCKLIKI